MKKIMFVLAVLVLAVPVFARVDITCAQVGVEPNVIVSFNNTEGQHVRAFALNIIVDGGATISAVECLNPDYYIYPGSIEIDEDTGEVTDDGSCVCDDGDYPVDTLPGLDSNGVTIEMASLYDDVPPLDDPCHQTPPADIGDLLKLTLSGCDTVNITIEGNVLRGKVVLEDATSVDPNAPGCPVVLPPCDPYADTCWSAIQCPGQSVGDATCDGNVNIMDILKVKQSWMKSFGQAGFNQCADFDHNCSVNIMDVLKVKQNWMKTGLGGDNTTTPPATCP